MLSDLLAYSVPALKSIVLGGHNATYATTYAKTSLHAKLVQ